VKYTLNLWCGKDDVPDRVVFEATDLDNSVKLNRLTERLLLRVLDALEEAKVADPRGFYTPIMHYPTESGDEYYVLRDGFFKLRPIFRDAVQELYGEYMERKTKPCVSA
jgi:hypothetical protein